MWSLQFVAVQQKVCLVDWRAESRSEEHESQLSFLPGCFPPITPSTCRWVLSTTEDLTTICQNHSVANAVHACAMGPYLKGRTLTTWALGVREWGRTVAMKEKVTLKGTKGQGCCLYNNRPVHRPCLVPNYSQNRKPTKCDWLPVARESIRIRMWLAHRHCLNRKVKMMGAQGEGTSSALACGKDWMVVNNKNKGEQCLWVKVKV